MNTQREHLVTGSLWGKIALIVFMLCFVSSVSAEAAVTVRAFTGTVNVLLKGEVTWKPPSEAMELNVGDEILTGKGSSVDLLSEDGSELHLGEETQLAISELEFSIAEKTRVSRFKLVWGTVTAKAASLVGLKKNAFKVETDTVVAGFKFSSMTIIFRNGETTLIPIDGMLEFQQKEGKTLVVYTSKDGVKTIYPLPFDALVFMEVTPGEPIQITSNVDIPNVTVTATSDAGTMEATLTVPANGEVNIGQDPITGATTIASDIELEVTIGEQTVTVGENSEIGIVVTSDGADITVNEGTATVDGETINEGESTSVETPVTPPAEETPPTEEEPAPAETTPEELVIPPEPERPPSEDTGSPTTPE